MSVRLIHIYKARLRMDDDTYRSMLRDRYGVESSTLLAPAQAQELTFDLYGLLPEADRAKVAPPTARVSHGGSRRRFASLENRDDHFATPAQLRMLEAEWTRHSRMATVNEKRDALVEFIRNRFAIGRLEWVRRDQVGSILRAITRVRPDATPRYTTQKPITKGA
ncbi:MAG TPA: DUF1018 domain-containing protein [Fibrobacteria bacterium]|nr:DUF1018 domain-containing protein [Fibrobacteria bacterium]